MCVCVSLSLAKAERGFINVTPTQGFHGAEASASVVSHRFSRKLTSVATGIPNQAKHRRLNGCGSALNESWNKSEAAQ